MGKSEEFLQEAKMREIEGNIESVWCPLGKRTARRDQDRTKKSTVKEEDEKLSQFLKINSPTLSIRNVWGSFSWFWRNPVTFFSEEVGNRDICKNILYIESLNPSQRHWTHERREEDEREVSFLSCLFALSPPQWVAKISPSSSFSFSSPTKTSPRFDWRDPQRRKGVNNKVPTLEWQQPFCQIFCPLDRKKEVFCRALYGRMGFGMACGGSVYIGEKYGISFSRFSVPIWFRGGRGVIFTLSLSRFLPKMTGLLCGWAWMIIWKEFRSTDLELRHMISLKSPNGIFLRWTG